jgi:hypothetical protein
MNRREGLNRFCFDHYHTGDENIDSISALQVNSFVLQWQRLFLLKRKYLLTLTLDTNISGMLIRAILARVFCEPLSPRQLLGASTD